MDVPHLGTKTLYIIGQYGIWSKDYKNGTVQADERNDDACRY